MYVVVVTEKGGSQQRIELDQDEITIGRVHGNDVVLPRGNVSKRHAAIQRTANAFQLTDLGSTNGTFVNGRRAREKQTVLPGDKVYVGDFIIHIEIPEPSGVRISVPVPERPHRPAAPQVNVVSEKAEKAPKQAKAKRPSVPPTIGRGAEPTERRVRVPKLTAADEGRPGHTTAPPAAVPSAPPPAGPGRATAAPAPPPAGPGRATAAPTPPPAGPGRATATSAPPPAGPGRATTASAPPRPPQVSPSAPVPVPPRPNPVSEEGVTAIQQVLMEASLALGVSEIASGNVALLPERVPKLRRVLKKIIAAAAEKRTLPEDRTPAAFAAEAFLSAVDLGPLNGWLADPAISEIRIFGPNRIELIRDGDTEQVSHPFASEAALADIVGRLVGAPTPDVHRHRLIDGTAVFCLDAPPQTIIVDKRWAVPVGAPESVLGPAWRVLSDITATPSKIAVTGTHPAARWVVTAALIRALPSSAFVAAVGGAPSLEGASRQVYLPPANDTLPGGGFEASVAEACALDADWLVVTETPYRHLPHLLAVATGRLGVLAELPLGAAGRLHRELAVALTPSGLGVTPAQAALFLAESFDVIVVADLTATNQACVKTVLASALGERGSWAPQVLFQSDVH